jgi:pyruvate/2-oxoglutarate/acetoin dehydrogenase E1 component
MPMTIIGAGGTAPNQALGAEHSQPLHAYVMGIPGISLSKRKFQLLLSIRVCVLLCTGLKICTAASPKAAYGLTKSMIRDNGPGILFLPVKMMKESKGNVQLDECLPLNKAAILNKASDDSVSKGRAVTVLTYLHGVKEAQTTMEELKALNTQMEIELIELRSLKPLDIETIAQSLERTHKLVILDESTLSGGVGATISARVSEQCYYQLDVSIVDSSICSSDCNLYLLVYLIGPN